MRNIRMRTDGRYEWRKQINSKKFSIINKNKKRVEQQARALLKQVKLEVEVKPQPKKFIDLVNRWYETYKKNIGSHQNYRYAINKHFNVALSNCDIAKITYVDLENFLNKIIGHRAKAYCYYIITGVFKMAYKERLIKEDISKLITKPKNKTIKGKSFTLQEQKLIIENLSKTPIKNEILFYILTGARREEGLRFKLNDIDLNNNKIFIHRTKRDSTSGYVPLSIAFIELLKNNAENMFKNRGNYYSDKFKEFLGMLNITGHKLHDLRHTFSTNLYYLGVPDKERQYYMGHSSITITNDIYTHLDPTITKNDILNLYKDLYPQF